MTETGNQQFVDIISACVISSRTKVWPKIGDVILIGGAIKKEWIATAQIHHRFMRVLEPTEGETARFPYPGDARVTSITTDGTKARLGLVQRRPKNYAKPSDWP